MKNHRTPLKSNPYKTIPDKHAFAFMAQFQLQVPRKYCGLNLGSLTEPLRAIVTVFYPSRRQDLSCDLIYDLLQKHHIVRNDRFIVEKHEYLEVDARNPRVEVTVEAI